VLSAITAGLLDSGAPVRRRRFARRWMIGATLAPLRHPPRTRGDQLGAPSDQGPQLLQEAEAVGAQVLRDKVTRKLGLVRGGSLRLFAWSGHNSPAVCGNGGKLRICSDSPTPQRFGLKQRGRARLYAVAGGLIPPERGGRPTRWAQRARTSRLESECFGFAPSQPPADAQHGRRTPGRRHESPISGSQVLAGSSELRGRRDHVFDGEELPGLVDAAQTICPTVDELQTAAGNEIPNRPGRKNFAALRRGGDPRPHMDRDSAELVADPLAFTGVHTRSHFEVELAQRPTDRTRAAHRCSRSFEA